MDELHKSILLSVGKLELGDIETADVSVALSLAPQVLGPFRLHSNVLCKADFFKTHLSETWTSGSDKKPSEILVKDCKDPTKYLRFFELLYMPEQERHFSSVEEALDILEVAAKLLCQELIDRCMKYLEAVPWTSQQEQAIASSISYLSLKPSADLALRLLPPPYGLIESTLLEDLAKTVTDVKSGPNGLRRITISGQLCKLMWLIEAFQRLKVADKAVKFLAEENELAKLVWEHVTACGYVWHDCRPFVAEVLNGLFGELQNGKLVVCKTVRIALVTSWFPVFSTIYDRLGNFNCGDWLESVLESLPLYDRHQVFVRLVEMGFYNSQLFKRVSSSWRSTNPIITPPV